MQGDSYHLRQSVDTQNKTFSPYSSSIETSSNEQMHNSSRPTFTPPNQRKSDASENAAKMIPIDIDMNLKENMEEHSTIYYDIQGLVLRRGQPFSFTITFNQDFPADKYNLSFIFKPQTWPNFPRVKIPLNGSSNGWSAERLSTKDQENNCVYFQICSPCDATIGKYSFFLEISPLKKDLATKQDLSIFQFDIDIYILFNPWNSTDVCGLLSSDQIAEYALSEHGQIYLGSCEVPRSIPWYFGQFERDVLLTALTLLNKTTLPTGSHIDISLILRRLSSKICSDPGENDGIFPPSSDEPLSLRQENGYTSSPAILKKYLLLNGQSVQGDSGSNWQHAAVFCSLCRSLGIPSRIVTVYNATCGAQEQEKINLYGDKRQQPIIVVNKKVTRPWYLWNECWMRRDDVPAQNSGWQVVDSSAIDYNTKMRRIGPCSVAALKSGSLALKWDTPEIYSVLNANRSYWLVYPDGSKKLIDMEDNVTDTKVLTKSLSKENVYDDITSNYKLKKSTSNETPYQIFPYHDVNIDIDIPNSLRLGDNLQVVLNATNQSNKPRTLALALRLIRLNPTIEIKPNSNKQTQDQYASQDSNPGIINTNSQAPIQSIVQAVRLDMNEYKSIPMKVADHHQLWTGCFDSLLKLYINAIVKETGQIYQKEKYIINEHDDIMQVSLENDVIEAGQPAKLQIHLNNSSSSSLNNAIITIDGFGISKPIPITEPLQSNTSTTIPVEFIPSRIGLSRLEVTLTSDSIRVPPKSVVLEVKQSISLNDQKQYEQLTSPNIDDEITSQPPREKNDRVQTEDLNATQPTFIPQTKTEATPHVASVPLPKSKSDNDVKSPLPPVSTDTAPVAEVKPKAPTASSSPKPAHEISAEAPLPAACGSVPETKPTDEAQAEAPTASTETEPTDEVTIEALAASIETILADEVKPEEPLPEACVPLRATQPTDEIKAEPSSASTETKPGDGVNSESPLSLPCVVAEETKPAEEVQPEASVLATYVLVPSDIQFADEFKLEAQPASSEPKPADEVEAQASLLEACVLVPATQPADEIKPHAQTASIDIKPADEEEANAPVLDAYVLAPATQPADEIRPEAPLLFPSVQVGEKNFPDEIKAPAPLLLPCAPLPETNTTEALKYEPLGGSIEPMVPDEGEQNSLPVMIVTESPHEITQEKAHLVPSVLVPKIQLTEQIRRPGAAASTETKVPAGTETEAPGLEAYVLVPGIQLATEIKLEAPTASSENHPTGQLNPEAPVLEASVPVPAIQLPDHLEVAATVIDTSVPVPAIQLTDEIKAEGTCVEPCVPVPGITLADETKAESVAVSSDRKPTDVVNPETPVLEARVPPVTIQLPDEIKAEGTVVEPCVPVPGITLADETKAESVAVSSDRKPTDVVNPETPVLEARVPPVTIQLPDEIKAEGSLLQPGVPVPGITLADETKAESVAVSSDSKHTDVVNLETPVLEARVPPVTIQLPDEIKAEGSLLQPGVPVPGITLADETKAEGTVVEPCVPVPGITLADETKAESVAVSSDRKPTDVVNPETPVLEARVPPVTIQLPDEIKAEGSLLEPGVPVPGITLAHETKAEGTCAEPCVPVPGITLADETKAESVAVSSDRKPTDVANPETPVLEARVPPVTIQLPDEIKAEGTVVEPCVPVPGITLADETKAESVAVSSDSKQTDVVNPETPVLEARVPPVTIQLPDEIKAEGTVLQACVLVPGVTLVDETRAESAAVCSKTKPTDVVNPETPVLEACVPGVDIQLPDEIKAEGTVLQACVLVPGVTLVDETRAESAAVCSKTKPTDVVNPETPVLEACVPGVDIQLPDEIKAEGTVLQACVLVPGIPLVDETKAESVAVSSEAKPTAVVTPETLVLEACVPVFTIQLPDGIKAEGAVFEACVPASAIRHTDEINAEALRASSKTRAFYDIKARTCTALNETKLADDVAVEAPALEACLVAVESRLAEEGRGEGQVASTETKPAYEVQGKARSLVSCVLVGETKPPDVVKAEAPAGSIVTFFADGVEAESRASCALTIPADEFKREASVHGGSVGLPHVEAYEEVKAEKALVGVIRTIELVDQSGTKICCEKLDDTENLPSGVDNFVTPDTLSETGNELESDLAISDLSTSCDVVVEDNSDAFEFESDGQVVGSANCDELGVVSLVPLVLRSERKLDVIDNVELLRILIVMTELLGIPVCADSSRKGVSCGEPATQGINASNISNAGRSNVPGCQEIPEGMIENLSKEVVTQEKVVEPDVRSGASVSDASKERVAEVALRSGSMLSPRILITEVEPFDCNESTLPEHLDAVNEVLTSDIEQLETDIVMNDGNSSSGDVTIISNHANVTNNAEDSSHTHSISGVPNTEFLPALETLDDLRKLERFKTMRSAAVQVVGDSTVVADKMDSGDAADINKLVTTSSNESNSKNETVSAVVDVAETPEGFVAKALAFFQRKPDGEKEPAEDDKQADVGDSEEEKFTLIEPVISNTVPPSGSEEEKKENDNLTNAATSRKIHEKVVDHVARVDVGSVIENINPAVIESKITLQGLSATIVDRKNIGDSKPIVVSPVQSQIECSGLVGNVEVTKQINDVKLESGFAVGSNEISSKGAAMGDNPQKFIDTKIEKITEAKMTEIENYYSTDTLIIFVIRNSFARIMMASLLVVCYARTMCEKQQLWILPKFCYIGLVFLILDWWIILLKVNIHRKLVEYFWINSGVAIFIIFTMPPLWISRYGYFIQSVKNLKVQAKHANINLESYVSECWDLKERKELDFIEFRRTESLEQALSTINKNISECNQKDEMNAGSWCSYGICLMKQMPDEMLEQVVVLSTICVRWMITGNLGLDQLITYFISTASDIVDFASTMVGQSEELIQDKNKDIMKAIIAAYFISLSQFSVNLSGKRKHNHAYDLILWSKAKIRERLLIIIDLLCSTEIWGILAQMATEDGLLLGLRILTIIKFNASTLENFFFAVKNSLTIAIFTYYAAAISDSYIRHRYFYQHYFRKQSQQNDQKLVSKRLIKRKSILKGSQSVKNESINLI
ncbi:unnamed protein product [Rotaria magnacalcarata]|uniref:Transglutaminase-like domain-containing protein n=11 Tax=Rotaria TaxID=231623 RepID=A0A815EY78_9BILA|nr:unnamed protein product [Rotaria magnacalcarata]